jgi:hypothetical protein
VGAFLGFLAHWAFVEMKEYSERRKLRKAYSAVAGDYVNFRIKANGIREPTGGTVRIVGQPDGSFKAHGLHPNHVVEWESIIRMSLELTGTGTGHYRYIDDAGHTGAQALTFIPEKRCFIVTATSGIGDEFRHYWKRREA